MALAISTNNAALNAAASASSVNRDMETSMARLSTGKRINSASDDAAGVAISSRLSAEIRGTDQAIRNSMDGQALIDTAEGAHSEIENILQRMREVSVQAANDTNNDQDRANLQAEMDAMVTEIDRIAGTTTWAGAQLMEAENGTTFSFQVGSATGDKNQINIDIGGMGAHALKVKADNTDVTEALSTISVSSNSYDVADSTLVLDKGKVASGIVSYNNGNTGNMTLNLGGVGADTNAVTVDISTAAGVNAAVTAINATAVLDKTGMKASVTNDGLLKLTDTGNKANGTTAITNALANADAVTTDVDTVNSSAKATIASTGIVTPATINGTVQTTMTISLGSDTTAGAITQAIDLSDVTAAVTAINGGTDTTAKHGVTASVTSIADGDALDGALKLTVASGSYSSSPADLAALSFDRAAHNSKTVSGTADASFNSTTGVLDLSAANTSTSITVTMGGNASAVEVTGLSGSDTTADGKLIATAINDAKLGYKATAGVDGNVTIAVDGPPSDVSVANASDARDSITAIDAAIKTVNIQRSELGAVSNRLNHTVNNLTNISSNLSAAKGGIEDADFALETTNLAKNQILQQASTAMLAQANASKQNVLSLLQG